MLKRVDTKRALPRSHSGVVATLLESQLDHYGIRAAKNNVGRLEATGIRAMLYTTIRGGDSCSCGITPYKTNLDDDGHLTPEAMTQISRRLTQNDQGMEVYNASDFDNAFVEDDTIETIESSVSIIPDIDILGLDDTRCAQCMGTGFVGGYTLANGFRTCLSAQNLTSNDTDGTVVRSEHPNVVEGHSWVEFTATLPLGQTYIYRLWNQDVFVEQVQPTVAPTLGVESTLRFTTDEVFSHIEVISLNSSIPIDCTTVHTEDADPFALVEVTFHLPAYFMVPLFSLITETKYNALWQVKQVTPIRDTKHAIIYQEVTARRVKANEIYRKLVGVI